MAKELSFNEIINTVSAHDAEKYAGKDRIKASIALFARFLFYGHVCWNHFPDELKNKFYYKIENLYNTPPEKAADVLKEMEKILISCVPDKHAKVVNFKNDAVLSAEEAAQISDKVIDKHQEKNCVGRNTVFTLKNDPKYEKLYFQKISNKHVLAIFEVERNTKKIGIVSLTFCPYFKDKRDELDEFLRIFKQKLPMWDAVVLDMRNNTGGDFTLIQKISKELYGNETYFWKSRTFRLTPEAKILQHKAFGNRYDGKHETGKSYYTERCGKTPKFDAHRGFNKNIYILTDRQTGSSAEFICELVHHPKVKFIGENTAGCGEYGYIRSIILPCGGKLRLGVVRADIDVKEGIGFAPKYKTSKGQDAFEQTLKIIDEDFESEKIETNPGNKSDKKLSAPNHSAEVPKK